MQKYILQGCSKTKKLCFELLKKYTWNSFYTWENDTYSQGNWIISSACSRMGKKCYLAIDEASYILKAKLANKLTLTHLLLHRGLCRQMMSCQRYYGAIYNKENKQWLCTFLLLKLNCVLCSGQDVSSKYMNV